MSFRAPAQKRRCGRLSKPCPHKKSSTCRGSCGLVSNVSATEHEGFFNSTLLDKLEARKKDSRTYIKTKWKTYVKHLKYKLYLINLSQSFWLLFWRSTVEGELDPKWQPLILCQDEKHNHTYKQKDGLVNENLHACLRHFISKVDKGREQHLLITFFIQTSHQLEHIMDLASCHKATSCSSSGCPSYVVWKKRRVIWWCSSDESWSKKELGLKGSDQVLIIVWNGMAQTIIFGLCYCHITID